ncbi:MAG: transketolase C-terminal domain-containing protein, partial [Oscillospiraceae bacterium]
IDMKGPKAIRYPKGTEDPLLYGIEASGQEFDLIKGSNGRKNLFITYGREFSQVLRSRDLMKIEPDILKLNVISPIPEEAVETAAGYDRVIFAEEAVRSGGIAERFLDLASQAGFRGRYVIRAVEDIIQKQASVIRQIERNGLDSASLADLAGEVFS